MIQTANRLPMLLDGQPLQGKCHLNDLLAHLRRWREALYLTWRQSAPRIIRTQAIAKAVDDLLSFALILTYIRQRDDRALPCPHDLLGSRQLFSTHKLPAAIRRSTRDPLLRAVFWSSEQQYELPIPASVMRDWLNHLALPNLGAACSKLPMSVFGAFRELCLSYALDRAAHWAAHGKNAERSSRGVFYTPAPIVDFLVTRVLQEAVKALDPGRVKQFRILDPSCGCGAFLIASLRFMLTWLETAHWGHLPPNGDGSARQKQEGWRLTPQACVDLAHSLLCGCDIDSGAIEWTIRLVHLTIWEFLLGRFPGRVINSSLRMPDYRQNIVCADFLRLGTGGRARTSFFDGVDAVLGGPPFVKLQQLHRTAPALIANYRRRFASARSGQFDMYMLFVEKSLDLLRPSGLLGMSISNTFLRSVAGRHLRSLLGEQCKVEEIVEFEDRYVYPEAITQIALLLARKSLPVTNTTHVWIEGRADLRRKLGLLLQPTRGSSKELRIRRLRSCACHSDKWSLASDAEAAFLEHLFAAGPRISRLPVSIRQGIRTGDDSVFLLRRVAARSRGLILVRERRSGRLLELEAQAVRPILRARDIAGYAKPAAKSLCLFPYGKEGRLLHPQALRRLFPRAYEYITGCRPRAGDRVRRAPKLWYSLAGPQHRPSRTEPVLIAGGIGHDRKFTLVDEPGILFHASVVLVYPEVVGVVDLHYVLAVLNSSTFWSFVRLTAPTMGEGRHVYRIEMLKSFPLFLPHSPAERDACAQVAETGRRLLLPTISEKERRDSIREADRRVAGLYGVTKLLSANMLGIKE